MFAGPLGRSTFTPPKSSFDSPLYGLVSLRQELADSADFRRVVGEVFARLPVLQGPLYVGKARRLQYRIRQHFSPLSPLTVRLRQASIPLDRCVLAYCLLDENRDTLSDEALFLIEDIITRVLRPGFVLRIG